MSISHLQKSMEVAKDSLEKMPPLIPRHLTLHQKAAGDLSLFTFYKNFDFPLVMVCATNVYGAYQQLFKIIPQTAIYIKNSKKIQLHGGGVAVKSYIHIRDVSNGELLIMEKGTAGEIYHISPDQGVTVKDIVQTICDKMGVLFEESVEVVPERLGQDKAYTIDSSKIRKELGWKPEISLAEGINQTVNWINFHFDAIKKEPLQYIHKA
jgi:dTDP-glucose 4,6-dehydratase